MTPPHPSATAKDLRPYNNMVAVYIMKFLEKRVLVDLVHCRWTQNTPGDLEEKNQA